MATGQVSVRVPNVTPVSVTGATQLSLADVQGTWIPAEEVSLRETTFVVVDLETTGGRATSTPERPESPAAISITCPTRPASISRVSRQSAASRKTSPFF